MSPEKPLEGVKMPPLPPRNSFPPKPSGLHAPPIPVNRMSQTQHPPARPVASMQPPPQYQPQPPWEVSRSPEIGAQAVQYQGEQDSPPSFAPTMGHIPRSASQEAAAQSYPVGKSSAIASMVLGIFVMSYASGLPVFAVIALPMSITGLILGIRALKTVTPLPGHGKGQAVTGIILSSVAIVTALLIIVLFSSLILTVFNMF